MTTRTKNTTAAALAALLLCSGAARAGDLYLSAQLDVLPAGKVDLDGERFDLDASAGFGATFEWAAVDFLALGLTVHFRSIKTEPFGDEAMSELLLDPTLRLLYPGEHFEPYVRGRIGGSFGWPPDPAIGGSLDSGVGWNWGVYGGLLARVWILGVFLEAGYGWSKVESYVRGLPEEHSFAIESRAFELGVGLAVIF
jgi:hypothetical protein